jgi:hypothetical protein
MLLQISVVLLVISLFYMLADIRASSCSVSSPRSTDTATSPS